MRARLSAYRRMIVAAALFASGCGGAPTPPAYSGGPFANAPADPAPGAVGLPPQAPPPPAPPPDCGCGKPPAVEKPPIPAGLPGAT